MYISYSEILLRLGLAALCGIMFGIERKHKNKPIGARTHILILLASCAVTIMSAYSYIDLYASYPTNVQVRSDPARLMVGLLTGIGFIGAGIIYKGPRGDIRGITTAAEVFLMAVIGMCFGLGLYMLGGVVSAMAFITLMSTNSRIARYLNFMKKNKKAEKPPLPEYDDIFE